jgi:hypothetical protein
VIGVADSMDELVKPENLDHQKLAPLLNKRFMMRVEGIEQKIKSEEAIKIITRFEGVESGILNKS